MLTLAVISTMAKNNMGEEDSFHLPAHSPQLAEVRAGTWRQALEERPRMNEAVYWLAQLVPIHKVAHPAQMWHHPQWTGPSHNSH